MSRPSQDAKDTLSPPVSSFLQLLSCPACRSPLKIADAGETIHCTGKVQHSFGVEEDIPLLFWDNEWKTNEDVTKVVKSFYEENPFPSYDDIDSAYTLRNKAEKSIFAKQLDAGIRHGSRILEAGCGTGQLSNFLGLTAGRSVFGTDMCLNSLKMGRAFKNQNEVENVAFLQMNLFRPVFIPGSFDYVISNGVLHHTSNPYLGFQTLLNLVKKNGYIIVGLYHAYGRLWTDLRCMVYKITGGRFKFLDARIRKQKISEQRKHIWYMDQYHHPHESKHTMGEVLQWFDANHVEFITSIPRCGSGNEEGGLFKKQSPGSDMERFCFELTMPFHGAAEGGFFIMIGQKK